jgi:8-oxo-dGTP pyrophosphatase MutT (NUDIX family)
MFMSEDLPPPIPAATLILMRPAGSRAPEVLMMERTATMAFAAGALVFPGGRIDAEDRETAAKLAPGLTDGADRIAAIRETIEETGIAAALSSAPDRQIMAGLREGIVAGQPFASLLAEAGLSFNLRALTPFARWCPAFRETRRFDTLFYLAEAPADAADAIVHEAEAVRAFWASAAEVLAEIEAGRARAIFPTRRNLERLARFASFEEARDDALRHPVQRITPWIEERHGQRWLCIPEGLGYPVTAELLETALRR